MGYDTPGRPRKSSRLFTAFVALSVGISSLVISLAVAAPAVAASLPRPKGAGPPVPASGMGTSEALANPRCRKTNPAGNTLLGGYGRFDAMFVGGGPVCVKQWKAGQDNGGATSLGVTKDKVKVVVVRMNDQQNATNPITPKHDNDMSPGTQESAFHDYVLPQMKLYETWGRDVEFAFVTSTGSDEAAQRADAVMVKAMKPFAVMVFVQGGLEVLESDLANAHIPTMGYATTATNSNRQAGYRWGVTDTQSAAVNSAEVIGKQLVGKKARYGGADVTSTTRKFGVVYAPTLVDYSQFEAYFKKYGGTIASANSYPSNGAATGDAAVAAEQAPTIVTRMKSAGVTTVILLSDRAMNLELMKQATSQEWFPEWFLTDILYNDLALFARGYPTEQSVHAFGLSSLYPWTEPDPSPPPPQQPLSVAIDPLNWYWGVGSAATRSPSVLQYTNWILAGVHSAGPKLTPKTFVQGLFSIPASGGAADNRTDTFLTGYGKSPGLPYDEYSPGGLDFAPFAWDTETTGPGQGLGNVGKGVAWYVDGAKRYKSGTWPKKEFDWFNKKTSVFHFETRQTPAPTYVDCQGCPSTGGAGLPGSPSEGFVAKASAESSS